MNQLELAQIAEGALQENAHAAIEEVVKNMQDPNTPWKNKREVVIKLKFTQNEERNKSACGISVEKKLAPSKPVETNFYLGKDIATGEVFMEEFGNGVRGQMSLGDYVPGQAVDGEIVDPSTGEIIGPQDTVVNFKEAVGGC